MLMRFDHVRILLLWLSCVVGLACSSSSNEGETCGGFTAMQCADDEYCDFTNNGCGIADEPGTCKRRPEACPDIYSPACACNGEVSSSACDAAAHGFDVSASGSCEPPAD